MLLYHTLDNLLLIFIKKDSISIYNKRYHTSYSAMTNYMTCNNVAATYTYTNSNLVKKWSIILLSLYLGIQYH